MLWSRDSGAHPAGSNSCKTEHDGWGSLSAGQLGAPAAELKEGLAARDFIHLARGVAEPCIDPDG